MQNGCKAQRIDLKILSIASWDVPINSTLQTMPFYSMAAFLMPNDILFEINRKMQKFLWNSSKDQHKTASVYCNST